VRNRQALQAKPAAKLAERQHLLKCLEERNDTCGIRGSPRLLARYKVLRRHRFLRR
jgi:hypothetical protein